MMRAAQTAALALLFVPISTIAYATLPQELNGDAAALFSMSRNVVGGLGISISTALITNHEQMRQAQAGRQSVAPSNSAVPRTCSRQVAARAVTTPGNRWPRRQSTTRPGQVMLMLRDAVADILAYNDVFLITACAAFVLIPTALLMSGVKPKAARPVAQ